VAPVVDQNRFGGLTASPMISIASALGSGVRPSGPRKRSMTVIVPLEVEKLHLGVSGRPEQRAIHALAPNAADQPFNERMLAWHIRHVLDLLPVQDSQISLPLLEPIQRIVVRADVRG
jgi:hypothetical protein